MAVKEKSTVRARGSDAVKAALIGAAAKMLGEMAPSRISVRDVAERAGVNHGQVHHYFGGKRALLKAAMLHLAKGHFEHSSELAGDRPFPPALSLAEDTDYWQAICQIVIEGDLDLARTDIDAEISVPREIIKTLVDEKSVGTDDLEMKARFAVVAAMNWGLVAFEDYLMLIADIELEQRKEAREKIKRQMQITASEILKR